MAKMRDPLFNERRCLLAEKYRFAENFLARRRRTDELRRGEIGCWNGGFGFGGPLCWWRGCVLRRQRIGGSRLRGFK
jgi:hypothetical protein